MVRPTIATNPVEVTETGHLTELLYDDGENDDLVICAAHGGAVEPGTGEQAVELATRIGATCWACLGYDEAGAFEAFHPPASEIDPGRYALLGTIADRGFDRVLSLHGLSADEILVGGGVDAAVKRRVRDRLNEAVSVPVAVADEDGPYAGTDDQNPVNWLAADGAGLQIEQGETPRSEESGAVLAAVEGLLDDGTL